VSLNAEKDARSYENTLNSNGRKIREVHRFGFSLEHNGNMGQSVDVQAFL